jgi:hypothetical protein
MPAVVSRFAGWTYEILLANQPTARLPHGDGANLEKLRCALVKQELAADQWFAAASIGFPMIVRRFEKSRARPQKRCIIGTSCRQIETPKFYDRFGIRQSLRDGSQRRRVFQSLIGGFPIDIGKESFDIFASTGGGIIQDESMLPNVHNQDRLEAGRHSILM